jgi:N-methylhydantoinase A
LSEASSPELPIAIAIDTGGTFTDVIAVVRGHVWSAKVPSTPDDPSAAVAAGIRQVLMQAGEVDGSGADLLIHGTTVATNALLERRGTPPRLVVNAGLRGILRIGRQDRKQLYALEPQLPQPLTPDELVVGVRGRLAANGQEVERVDEAGFEELLKALESEPPATRPWAISLLHSWTNPAHEERLAALVRRYRPLDQVSVSNEVLPQFREYERTVTTVANAYVLPKMGPYLSRLKALAGTVEIMGSSGRRLRLEDAARLPVLTALSGPAGGVVGATLAADRAGLGGIVAFDMGGTSTDVCTNAAGGLQTGGVVGDIPLHVPMLDIHTIGAGGGSVIWLDAGGSLRVGPRSAGASPGPACYGRGDEPTITDAHVVLGRIPPSTKLGGSVTLDVERAGRAFAELEAATGADRVTLAKGAIRIASEAMAQAIRRMTVARGVDPRELTLCAFGGAGALHLCEIASILEMERAFVPPWAGILSAVGMLASRPGAQVVRTVLGLDSEGLNDLVRQTREDLGRQWGEDATVSGEVRMRYRGQSHELPVAWQSDPLAMAESFRASYRQLFGYEPDAIVEWVNLEVRAELPARFGFPDAPAQVDGPVRGPSAIVDAHATTWVEAGWIAAPVAGGGLLLSRE